MKMKILTRVLTTVLPLIFEQLGPEYLRKGMDRLLDWIEDTAIDSKTTVDDKIVLPLCRSIREAFNIPDDD